MRDREPHGVEVCELSTTFQLKEDNSLTLEYFMGDDLEHCQSISGTGTWEYFGDHKFELQIDGGSDLSNAEIYFPEENTMELLYGDEENTTAEYYARQ